MFSLLFDLVVDFLIKFVLWNVRLYVWKFWLDTPFVVELVRFNAGLFIWAIGLVFVVLGLNWPLLLVIFAWDIVDAIDDEEETGAATFDVATIVVVWILTGYVFVETGDEIDWVVSTDFVYESDVSKFFVLVLVICCWLAEFDAMLAYDFLDELSTLVGVSCVLLIKFVLSYVEFF
jgi:hypothetical protein